MRSFSIAIFCACLALAFGVEIVVFSPARRASRKLLERIVEFVNLAGGSAKICEYNQACAARWLKREVCARALRLASASRCAGGVPDQRL